jgi:hypothetical protein
MQKETIETRKGRHLISKLGNACSAEERSCLLLRTPHDEAIYDHHSTECLTLEETKDMLWPMTPSKRQAWWLGSSRQTWGKSVEVAGGT